MKMQLASSLLFLFLVNVKSQTVELPQGALRGLTESDPRTGSPIFSFKGIPYGKPPIEGRRFKRSQRADGWQVLGVRNGLNGGSELENCVQLLYIRTCCPSYWKSISIYVATSKRCTDWDTL